MGLMDPALTHSLLDDGCAHATTAIITYIYNSILKKCLRNTKFSQMSLQHVQIIHLRVRDKVAQDPHPLAFRRQLDFLEDFDSDTSSYRQSLPKKIRDSTDTDEDDEDDKDVADVEREYELLVRRGWTYSVRLW